MGRVMIVDDDREVREAFGALCATWGHEVTTAADGAEALALAAAFRPDVVLLDLGLRGVMEGRQVARHIREAEGTGVFIVALTGWTSTEVHDSAVEAGADAVYIKPPDLGELERTVALGVARPKPGRAP